MYTQYYFKSLVLESLLPSRPYMLQRPLSSKEIRRVALARRSTALVDNAEDCLQKMNIELKAGIKNSRGKPLVISSHNLSLLLVTLTLGGTDEEAYTIAQIGKTTYYKYIHQSFAFANAVLRAKYSLRYAAVLALEQTLTIVPSHWEEVYNPKTKKYDVKFIKAKEPSDKLVMWVLAKQAPEEFGDCKRKHY